VISIILTVALAHPCMLPVKAPAKYKHHKAHAPLFLPSCVRYSPKYTPVAPADLPDALTAPVAMCYRAPEPDPEPITLPQVVPYYVVAPATSDAMVPYAPSLDLGPAGGGWVLVPGVGGPVGAPPPHRVPQLPRYPFPRAQAPEIDAGGGLGACLLLGGCLAVIRGRRPS
jgi:hypothetical protein